MALPWRIAAPTFHLLEHRPVRIIHPRRCAGSKRLVLWNRACPLKQPVVTRYVNQQMGRFETCVDCGKQSPRTETGFTLISQRFGWRLRRERLSDGNVLVEWRCPECWNQFKQRNVKPIASTKA
jgi:hypothetical protein